MAKPILMSFRLDPRQVRAMRRLQAAIGMPYSVMVRRALKEWLRERPTAWLEQRTRRKSRKEKRS